jgi:hypothetical protein
VSGVSLKRQTSSGLDLFGPLTSVDLSGNKLRGTLPPWLLLLPHLEALDVSGRIMMMPRMMSMMIRKTTRMRSCNGVVGRGRV